MEEQTPFIPLYLPLTALVSAAIGALVGDASFWLA
jgi:hypothetical protein